MKSVLLIAAAALAGSVYAGDVSVRAIDPDLKILEARVERWTPKVGEQTFSATNHYPEMNSPVFGRITGPQWLAQDVLLVFGTYREPLAMWAGGVALGGTNAVAPGL